MGWNVRPEREKEKQKESDVGSTEQKYHRECEIPPYRSVMESVCERLTPLHHHGPEAIEIRIAGGGKSGIGRWKKAMRRGGEGMLGS